MAKDEMTQKDKEEEAASGPAGILSSILGLAAPIAGMIPSLRQGPQKKELQKYQRGQGAGASLARRTASEAGRRVVGAAGQRGGSGALREGLRTADKITAQGAAQAATTGAQEGLAATQMLNANEQARRGSFRRLGGAVGAGLSSLAATMAASRDQGATSGGGEEADGGRPIDSQGGFVPQASGGWTSPEHQANAEQAAKNMAATRGPGALATRQTVGELTQAQGQFADTQTDLFNAQNARQNIVQEMMAGLSNTTAQKQDAAKLMAATSSTAGEWTAPATPTPPPMTDPAMVEEWVYNQVFNYMPGPVEQGLTPEQGAQILIRYGFEPDYAALGLVPMSEGAQANVKPAPSDRNSQKANLDRKAVHGAMDAGRTIREMITGGR